MGATVAGPAIAVPPTLFITDAEVAQLADWSAAVEALRRAYSVPIAPAMVPPRSMARGEGIWLRGLTAVSPAGGHMGCKLIAASMKAQRASYLISLFDQTTMALAALIDGNRITGIRTAATAAVAVDKAAPSRPLRVAVIGSGFEAQGLLAALAAVRQLSEVRVFSPTPASRERFAEKFRLELSLAVTAVTQPEEAVKDVDVILCAARSRDERPVIHGDWLAPGMTVVSIGSTLPEQREVDERTVARATCIIADMPEEVAHDTGDMLAATRAGVDFAGKLAPLSDFVGGLVSAGPQDIVLYKSVGSALQDVVIAEMLLVQARHKGLGCEMLRSIVPVAK